MAKFKYLKQHQRDFNKLIKVTNSNIANDSKFNGRYYCKQGHEQFAAVGYGGTYLHRVNSTTLQYEPDPTNKPNTNVIVFFPAIEN